MKQKQKSEIYSIDYGGDSHEIDSKTLSSSLSRITEVINEINAHLKTGKKVELKVKALAKGSFEIHLEVVQFIIDNNLLEDDKSYIGNIIEMLCELVKLLKILGDKPPISVIPSNTNLVIKGEYGEITVDESTYDFLANNEFGSTLLREHFLHLDDDEQITSFSILDNNKKQLLLIDRNDFKLLAAKKELANEKKHITDRANLTVFKVVFGIKYKWQFYYKGNKISAQIIDIDFFKRIEQGEAFAQGDVLSVDLKIIQIFDEKVNAFINTEYEVIKVLNHIPRAEQMRLRLE